MEGGGGSGRETQRERCFLVLLVCLFLFRFYEVRERVGGSRDRDRCLLTYNERTML